MGSIYVFIDEFGNPSLNLEKAQTPSHFVYAALLISEENLDQARKVRELISKSFFRGSPIKSKNIPSTEKGFKDRLAALEMLKQLDFIVSVLVVDKSKIEGPGFKYRKSFYKYFQKTLLGGITKNSNSYNIFLDKLGWPEFHLSLKKYLNERVFRSNDLFDESPREFELVEDSKEEPLIQLADLLAGSLGKIYCTSHVVQKANEIFNVISDRVFVEFYPSQSIKFMDFNHKPNIESDKYIKQIALDSAKNSLVKVDGLSDEAIMVLEYLILIFISNTSKLVASYEIINRVRIHNPKFSEADLRLCIRNLRDSGVLIASIPGKSGYKLPDCTSDIVGFYKRYLNNIIPSIKRIDLCNKRLKLDSVNKVDLFSSDPRLSILKDLIKVVQENKEALISSEKVINNDLSLNFAASLNAE